MTTDDVIAWLEGIVFGGIALTTEALEYATGGRDLSFAQWRAILQVGNGEDGCRVLERDEQDRRATRARLTPAGAELRSSVLGYRRDEIAAIVDAVRPAATADRTLRDLAARFDARGQIPRRLNGGASDSEAT
jgi:hypothetical protein